MEDMWRTRRPPEALDYGSLVASAKDVMAKKESVLKGGQTAWTLEENVVVFKDRYAFAIS